MSQKTTGRFPLDAIKLLESQAVRGRPRRIRNATRAAILAGIEAMVHEAHIRGRIYSRLGEARMPDEEHRATMDACRHVFSREFTPAAMRARPSTGEAAP